MTTVDILLRNDILNLKTCSILSLSVYISEDNRPGGNTMDKNQKLADLFQNQNFKKEAESIQTAEELKSLFAKHGVDLTQDELLELCAGIAAQMKEDELSEGDLEAVGGGFAMAAVTLFALGASCIGCLAGSIYDNAIDKAMYGEKKTKNETRFRKSTNFFGGEFKQDGLKLS